MVITLERKDGVSTFRQEHHGVNEHELLGETLRRCGLSKDDAEKIRTDPKLATEATKALQRIVGTRGWDSSPITEHQLFGGKNK